MAEKKAALEKAVPGDAEKNGRAVMEEVAGTRFTKGQLLSSGRFRGRRDIVDALLTDGGQYTIKAVEQMVEKYMKGRVK